MQPYIVNYSLGSHAGITEGAFNSSTLTQNLRTTVMANGMGQAREMVQAMYGPGCQIHSCMPA